MLAHKPARRHDLDALRAVAMLLGIVLHASLAYVPGVRWPVHDTQTAPALGVIAVVIHGFRMPLFFLLSGYFTALLWRSRGCVATLRQRVIRVFIPLLVASATLVPLFNALGSRAAQRPRITPATSGAEDSPLVRAIRGRDPAAVANAISTGIDIGLRDPEFGIPPITLAAIVGEPEVVRILLDAGADPDALGQDGRTPLHGAAFAGRIDAAALLLDRGAAAAPRLPQGDTPLDSARADEATTAALAGLLRIGLDDSESLAQRRAAIVKLLARRAGIDAGSPPALGAVGRLARARDAYRAWLLSPRWTMTWLPGLQPQSLVLGNAFN